MTDNDIINAMEHCHKISFKNYPCENCPLINEECFGGKVLMKRALDLIKRQKAEKEALIAGQETLQKHIAKQKAEIESLEKIEHFADKTIARLQAEIESKNDLIHRQSDVISEQKEKLESIYSEAIKEFAERIRNSAYESEVVAFIGKVYTISETAIKNAIKETAGES